MRLASNPPSSLRAMIVELSWLAFLPTKIVVQGIRDSFPFSIYFGLRTAFFSLHSKFSTTGNRRKNDSFFFMQRIHYSTGTMLFPVLGLLLFSIFLCADNDAIVALKTTKKVEGKPHPEQLSAVFRGECWKIDAGTRAGI